MRVVAALCLVGLAASHGSHGTVGMDDWMVYKQWSMMKAQESCWGEENMKLHTVNIKKAVAKCSQQDAPELGLPPFRAPYRFINTLLTGADEMEQRQAMFLYNMMQKMKQVHYNQHQDEDRYSNYHSGFRPYSMDQKESWMEKMMMNVMMKKNYDNMDYGSHKDMDYSMYSSNNNDFEQMMEERMLEEKIRNNMMMYKIRQMKDSDSFSGSFREKMEALLRHRRDAPADVAVTLPESLDLGDRLADKLKEQQRRMQAEVGNMTCVLREMGVINEQNELDFISQKREIEKFQLPSKWFKERILNDMEVCNKVAEALPEDAQEHIYPGYINISKVNAFMKCCKNSKLRTCMYQDIKKKIETNFGPLDKILEQTQLTEEQLFPLVNQLLQGEEAEYSMF